MILIFDVVLYWYLILIMMVVGWFKEWEDSLSSVVVDLVGFFLRFVKGFDFCYVGS